jgi:preprotein translocase subunit SecA
VVTIATNMAGRGVDILLGGNPEGLAREQLRREQIDLSTVKQNEWNRAVDMLTRGRDPLTEFGEERWAQVLAEKWHETENDKNRVRSLGGLHVVGTERHEARRIDNQLRGRAGRLGDPGSSRFYLALDDELMRRFGGDRISGIMSRLGVEEDVPIEAGLVNRAIENAQTKVEGYNFDTRKHVLRYDEVVNEQRNRMYEQRRRILTEPSLRPTVEKMIEEEVRSLVAHHTAAELDDEWKLKELGLALKALIHHLPDDFSYEHWQGMKQDEIADDAVDLALGAYDGKEEDLSDAVMRQAEKQIMLWAVDNRWIRHLTDLDRLREGIGLQAFAQVDPVVAYKRESFEMYNELLEAIRSDTVKAVFSVALQKEQPVAAQAPAATGQLTAQAANGQSGATAANGQPAAQPAAAPRPKQLANIVPQTPIARNIRTNKDAAVPQTVKKSGPQLGRNDPCWCGSGKKYKACHMASDASGATTPKR